MAAGRMVGVHDMTGQGNTRGYKQMDNRFDIGNHLQLGGYQNTSANTGWSDDANMAFDQSERFGAASYNRFMGGSAGYMQNAYATTLPNSKTGLMPHSTSNSHVGTNSLVMGTGVHSSSDLQVEEAQTNAVTQGQNTQMDIEDVAHHFVFRYYSLLHSNPSGLFNLYAKTAQLCKPDMKGNRVVANGHSEIKNFYSQFVPTQITSVIKKIEVQTVVNQSTLIILLIAEITSRASSVPETQVISQMVALGADQAKARYHILNDIAVTGMRSKDFWDSDKKKETPKMVEKSPGPRNRTNAQSKVDSFVKTIEEDGMTGKEPRDKTKIVIFGLPSSITEKEVRDGLMERMKSRTTVEGRIIRIDLKKHYPNSEKSPMYAFVHLDSVETGESLIGENFVIRGRQLNVDFYKRNHQNREGLYNRGNARNKANPVAW